MIKYKAIFQKKGNMVYISHLDLMTLFRRAIRRAELPFILTKGFTPRVKISMPKALKLGRSSDSEEITLWLKEEEPSNKVMKAINEKMPDDVKLLKIDQEKLF